MATQPPTDEHNSDVTTTFVCINKQYDLKQGFDASQDVWKLTELDNSQIDIESLREDILQVFRKAKWINPLFKNKKEYEWKIYSYDQHKAEIEIEDDDDLQDEINEFNQFITTDSDASSTDDGLTTEKKYLKLRVVFFKSVCMYHNDHITFGLIPPELRYVDDVKYVKFIPEYIQSKTKELQKVGVWFEPYKFSTNGKTFFVQHICVGNHVFGEKSQEELRLEDENDYIRYESEKKMKMLEIENDKLKREKENANKTLSEVEKKAMEKEKENKYLREKAANIGYIIKWEWDETPWRSTTTWKSYEFRISKKIDELKLNQSFQFKYGGNKQTYKITKTSKHTAFQINIKSRVQRAVRRVKKKIETVISEIQSEKEKYKLKAEEEEKKAKEKQNEYKHLKETLGYKVVWEIDKRNNGIFRAVGDKSQTIIENLQIGESYTFTGKNSTSTYKIVRQSKDTAIETKVGNNKLSWPVRRTEKASGLNQIEYPEWWSATGKKAFLQYTEKYSTPVTIKLDLVNDSSAKEIVKLFNKTMKKYDIIRIEAVKNQMLFDKYYNERESVLKLIGENKLNEKYLFHGTQMPEVMDSVLVQGFRKEFNKTSKWGKGTYFARDAAYAARFASRWYLYNYLQMFVCKVICGESVLGNNKYQLTTWPVNSVNGLIYDSLVDNLKDPSIYVIHENVRAYPMYIVTFTKYKKYH